MIEERKHQKSRMSHPLLKNKKKTLTYYFTTVMMMRTVCFLLFTSFFLCLSYFTILVQQQSQPTPEAIIMPPASQKEARVLVGIFTAIDKRIGDRQKIYRDKFRALFKLHPNVCSIGDLHRNEHKNDHCKFIYAFVVGANQDPTAPTVLYNDDREVEVSRHLLPFLQHSYDDFVLHDDFVFLNIHENMNEGKSLSWFYYAATDKFLGSLQIDYVGKMDTDVMLDMKLYFEFSKKNLAKAPYEEKRHTLVGHLLQMDEAFVEENNFPYIVKKILAMNYTNLRLYPQGGFYLMSMDLAQSIIKFVKQSPILSILLDFVQSTHEDVSMGTLAFLSVVQSGEIIDLILISISNAFYIHPFKRKLGATWKKKWDELMKNQAQDQQTQNEDTTNIVLHSQNRFRQDAAAFAKVARTSEGGFVL